MKAYIIKITFQYIEPVICRRIVMPAGATFNRLHETIQHVTNFQSADEPYHSYAFEVDNYYITNNEFILAEYKGSTYVGRQVKSPIRMKIDTYLEKNGKILYEYDFGDSWMIDLELESIVEDYYFGYPTVLTGAGIAPPEDVGGPPGYEEFLQVYHDPTHPDYLQQYSWAESQRYLPFDIDEVNERLKYVKYQKTEWQHIEHDNYYVLSNKYRRSDVVDIELIPDRELVMKYVAACANLYGIIQHSQFLKIYNSQNERQLTSKELRAIFADPMYNQQLKDRKIFANERVTIHGAIEIIEDVGKFMSGIMGKPFYIPEKVELLRYAQKGYYEKTAVQQKLEEMIAKDFYGGSMLQVPKVMDELIEQLQSVQVDLKLIIQAFFNRYICEDVKQMNNYVQIISECANTTRLWENRGHTPDELFQMEKHYLKPLPNTPFQVIDGGKVGRNDPCTCGSGKKYKKCCGK